MTCPTTTPPVPPSIDVSNISVWYGRDQALQTVTGSLLPGSLTAIIGPNGSGKSTLLKTMMGLVKPLSGCVSPHPAKLRTMVSYLPQQAEIDRSFPLRVEDFVTMGLWSSHGGFREINEATHLLVHDVLTQVGLHGFEERPLDALSGGQFQRVMFARLVIQDAPIVFLDEPFTGVDAQTTHDLMGLILDWHARGKTVVAVLHDLDIVKDHFKSAVLLDQKVLAWGPLADVLHHKGLWKLPLCSHTVGAQHDPA